MSNTLRFYQDAGMSVPLNLAEAVQADDGAAAAVDRVAYLGSPVAGKKFQAASAPGLSLRHIGRCRRPTLLRCGRAPQR